MVLTALIVLLLVGYAVGVGSGVLRVRRQADCRVSSSTRSWDWRVWTLRGGGLLLVACAGGVYLWVGAHPAGLGSLAIPPYWLFCEVPVWLHNRCLPVESETR